MIKMGMHITEIQKAKPNKAKRRYRQIHNYDCRLLNVSYNN